MATRSLKNPAFCVLPFIQKYQGLDDKKYFCCHSSIPIDEKELDSLRLKILAQETLPHCDRCYLKEKKNSISPRQIETGRAMRDVEIMNYIENWEPGKSQTFYYDIRFDNKCNLACIMCNPVESSLWAKELNITSNHQKNMMDFDINEALYSKKVYLAGGEPFIIDKFLDFISAVSRLEKQPHLVINTNLTSISDTLKETLRKIKHLTLIVSIDAYGSVNEYHRWPMKWNKLIKNLEWCRSLDCNIIFNTVADAVSILNMQEIQEIEHLVDSWNITILDKPKALCIQNLPRSLKLSVFDDFCKIKNSRFYKKDAAFKIQVESIAKMILEDGDEKSLIDFLATLDKRRNINHADYLGVRLF